MWIGAYEAMNFLSFYIEKFERVVTTTKPLMLKLTTVRKQTKKPRKKSERRVLSFNLVQTDSLP